MKRPIVLILGPTAGGKTELSICLAERLPGGGECICCDSMQVYRGMDIGTAKPTAHERSRAVHHLLDIADPSRDDFSVDRWLQLAEGTIDDVRTRERWPIVVGGTNLYVQALLFGLFDGPAADPERRAELQTAEQEELRAHLERADPEAASRIHPNDRKRTIRAIEVFEATGTPISALQSQWEASRPRDDIAIIGLDYGVDAINRRINARVKRMMAQGLLEEVRRLDAAGQLGPQASEALGYKQLVEHLRGGCSLVEAVEQIKIRTRRYAKQQRSWLRRFRPFEPALWIDAASSEPQDTAEQALTFLSEEAAEQ